MLRKSSGIAAAHNKKSYRSYVYDDIHNFINSDYDEAEVVIEGKSGRDVRSSLAAYISYHSDECEGIGVFMHNGRAYLYKKGGEA